MTKPSAPHKPFLQHNPRLDAYVRPISAKDAQNLFGVRISAPDDAVVHSLHDADANPIGIAASRAEGFAQLRAHGLTPHLFHLS